MIGVVRAGKNPTMRHLERSHGISVAWMHDVFQANYVSLAYEVTAKMAADIHTKAFRDGLSWQHACQLINIFPPQQLNSQEIMDLMRPTRSQSEDARGQKLLTFKNEVPCFPYTQTPILPQVLYREGLSGKEGLQEIDGADPILVVKFPKLLRVPPRALHPGRYLRSTWVLREGEWKQIEDRAIIPPETQKFDRYVERAVFQYHFQRRDPPGSVPPAAVTVAAPSSFSGPGVTVSLRLAAPDTRLMVALLVLAAHGGSRGSFRGILSVRSCLVGAVVGPWTSMCSGLSRPMLFPLLCPKGKRQNLGALSPRVLLCNQAKIKSVRSFWPTARARKSHRARYWPASSSLPRKRPEQRLGTHASKDAVCGGQESS